MTLKCFTSWLSGHLHSKIESHIKLQMGVSTIFWYAQSGVEAFRFGKHLFWLLLGCLFGLDPRCCVEAAGPWHQWGYCQGPVPDPPASQLPTPSIGHPQPWRLQPHKLRPQGQHRPHQTILQGLAGLRTEGPTEPSAGSAALWLALLGLRPLWRVQRQEQGKRKMLLCHRHLHCPSLSNRKNSFRHQIARWKCNVLLLEGKNNTSSLS